MIRSFSKIFNFLLILSIGLGLSGCITTRLPIAVDSPWQAIELGTESNPLDIDFVDSNHGFLVGTNRMILETSNGGETWQERILDLPTEENFRLISIDFNDGDEGWIAGQPGLLLHTLDGGKNWTRLSLGSKLPGEPYLVVASAKNSAELATTAGAVYTTSDGGSTWEGRVSDSAGGVRDLRRSPDGRYVSVSSLGNFFATLEKDQENWELHQRLSSKRVQSMGFQPSGQLWMLARGAEIRLNDNPQEIDSWKKAIIPITNGYNYLDMAWGPNNQIWAAGGSGTLIVSNDGGDSWSTDPVGSVQPTNFIRILFEQTAENSTKGFILGERGRLLRWVG